MGQQTSVLSFGCKQCQNLVHVILDQQNPENNKSVEQLRLQREMLEQQIQRQQTTKTLNFVKEGSNNQHIPEINQEKMFQQIDNKKTKDNSFQFNNNILKNKIDFDQNITTKCKYKPNPNCQYPHVVDLFINKKQRKNEVQNKKISSIQQFRQNNLMKQNKKINATSQKNKEQQMQSPIRMQFTCSFQEKQFGTQQKLQKNNYFKLNPQNQSNQKVNLIKSYLNNQTNDNITKYQHQNIFIPEFNHQNSLEINNSDLFLTDLREIRKLQSFYLQLK